MQQTENQGPAWATQEVSVSKKRKKNPENSRQNGGCQDSRRQVGAINHCSVGPGFTATQVLQGADGRTTTICTELPPQDCILRNIQDGKS